MLTLDIDLAAQPEKTAACLIEWHSGIAEVHEIQCNVDDNNLLRLLANSDKAGIDVPLGWPTGFVRAIAQHEQFLSWPATETRTLRYRETDLFIAKETGHWPLSVSTDRIGVPAMRAVALLSLIDGPIDRSGRGKVVEVYPAAALCRWGFESRGYKGHKGEEKRRSLVNAFLHRIEKWLHVSTLQEQECSENADSFDALVCSLVARANAIGRTVELPAGAEDRARIEGWIALPLSGSLERLAG